MPIVEPEVTLGPGDYGIQETAYWSERVYSHVFRLLNEYNVALDGILLKPNMCLPGVWPSCLDCCTRTRTHAHTCTHAFSSSFPPPVGPGGRFSCLFA